MKTRYLWDTHALIWGMEDDPQLSERARELAPQGRHCISDITLWEVACLCDRKRITLKVPLEEWLAEACSRLDVVPITPRIATVAYELEDFHGDPADRLIAATSIELGLRLVTKDEKLKQCRALECVWD